MSEEENQNAHSPVVVQINNVLQKIQVDDRQNLKEQDIKKLEESTREERELIKRISRRYYRLCIMAVENPVLRIAFENPDNIRGFLTNGKDKNDKPVWTKEQNGGEIQILDDQKVGEVSAYAEWPGVGMTLPEEVLVILDHSILWPTMVLSKHNENKYIRIKELPRMISVFSAPVQKIGHTKMTFDELGTVKIYLDKECEKWDFTLHMPNLVPNVDALTEVFMGDKSDENPDIILTTC